MAAWLLPLATLAQKRMGDDPRAVGGKAAHLAWLQRHGFAVPEAWVLPEEAFAQMVRGLALGNEPRALLRAAAGRAGSSRAAEARDEILKAPLPRGLEVELEALWQSVEARAPWGLAVRSSATCEDGALVSMAGLAETILGVRGPEALAMAIRTVWASVASGRALSYLAAHGVRDVGMAVVLQRVVEARAAGVMFTRAPGDHRGRSADRIINAGFGLGSPVVNGASTPDVLRIDTRGRVVEALIAQKEKAIVIGAEGPVEQATAAPAEPALKNEDLLALAEVAARLERIEAAAWDVEFACDVEKTWVVQARPATGRGFPDGGDMRTVWSGANVGEALPGVATPLTWSVAGAFSEEGFRSAFATLGCRVPKGARLVGNIHGRIYLNLTEFMRIAAQVPFLDPRLLVELGGGSGGDELAVQVEDVSKKGFFVRLPFTAARVARQQLALDDEIARFEAEADKARRLHTALDLAILPDDGLARKIRDVQALLAKTGTVMLTTASSALAAHLALSLVIQRVSPVGADHLAQALTGGIRDLESARPAIGILNIANLARREPETREVLLHEDTVSVEALPDGQTRRALVSFLELYGDRGVREAELSTPRWAEDPRPVLTMLRVALRGEGRDVESALHTARAHADLEMTRLMGRVGFVEQTLIRHLVVRAQKAARLRERMRAWVTRVLGMLRQAFVDADRRLRRRDPELEKDMRELAQHGSPLAAIGPAFYLTIDELVTALRTGRTDLAPLVRARRADFARDLARPDPPPTFVGAPPPVVIPPASGDLLRGLPASGGVVEGKARVLHGEHEMGLLQPGEILVVHTTDVGWTPLFPIAAGVVTELGGPLSHAAIVAREFGVPSVVNVDSATRILRTGDRLRLDGDRGVVERLGRHGT